MPFPVTLSDLQGPLHICISCCSSWERFPCGCNLWPDLHTVVLFSQFSLLSLLFVGQVRRIEPWTCGWLEQVCYRPGTPSTTVSENWMELKELKTTHSTSPFLIWLLTKGTLQLLWQFSEAITYQVGQLASFVVTTTTNVSWPSGRATRVSRYQKKNIHPPAFGHFAHTHLS